MSPFILNFLDHLNLHSSDSFLSGSLEYKNPAIFSFYSVGQGATN